MRFFRNFFWIAAVYNLICGGLLIFAPSEIAQILGYRTTPPLSLIQTLGLFLGLLGASYAYVAERPSKSMALVGLGTLAHMLMPLFAYFGWRAGELNPGVLWFHLANDLVWLPFFGFYYFWYSHRPRPREFQHFMGVFGTYFKNKF